MHAEREELVKHVFPQLRKLCGERGVTWGEVDLRWGITEEEKAEGKVLPICLAEIPEEIIEQEPWLKDHLKHSVTELEILHGVLNNPEMAEHAFFYFRATEASKKVEEELAKVPNYQPEPEAISPKLKSLKERIDNSGFPVRKDYSNPKAFGEQALKSPILLELLQTLLTSVRH